MTKSLPTRREVQFIRKSDRKAPHQRLNGIGGSIGNYVWQHTEEGAIKWIENGTFAYFVNRNAQKINVIIAKDAYGDKYLKTFGDGEQPDSLLSLPECP